MKPIKEIPTLNFEEAIQQAAHRIVQFDGRARRSEFWWTQLLVLLASIVLTPLGGMLIYIATIPLTFRRLHDTGRSGWWLGFKIILNVLTIVIIIYDFISLLIMPILNDFSPSIATSLIATIGKHLFLWMAIFLWDIILIILLCTDSDPKENQYGPSPKYIPQEEQETKELETA